jgi:hypothetical protein
MPCKGCHHIKGVNTAGYCPACSQRLRTAEQPRPSTPPSEPPPPTTERSSATHTPPPAPQTVEKVNGEDLFGEI